MKARWFLCLSACILALTGCTKGKALSRSDLGDAWPFVVREGVVDCVGMREVVFRANGQTYALNGNAMTQAKRRGYADDISILRRDEKYPELFMSTDEVIQLGLAECK